MMPKTRKKYKAISQINNGNSSGMDVIPAVVLKYSGDRLKKFVFEVISHIWDSSAPHD